MPDEPFEESSLTGSQVPRLWQVPDAEAELGTLRRRLATLKEKAERALKAQTELERMEAFWGKEVDAPDTPDAARRQELSQEFRELEAYLTREVEALHALGIEVKDLESGLVDFYALRKGELILLCWQKGEEGIRYWHTLAGGFRGRRPLTPSERAGGLEGPPARRSRPSGPPPGYL
jgi:hypothetical protein